MLNWCGQDIVPGSVVGRGAREGNGSSYKIGRVLDIKEVPNRYGPPETKAKVQWLHNRSDYGSVGTSTCELNGLFLLDPNVLLNFPLDTPVSA